MSLQENKNYKFRKLSLRKKWVLNHNYFPCCNWNGFVYINCTLLLYKSILCHSSHAFSTCTFLLHKPLLVKGKAEIPKWDRIFRVRTEKCLQNHYYCYSMDRACNLNERHNKCISNYGDETFWESP